jgi:hypothetical protein
MKAEYPKWIYHKDHAPKIVLCDGEWNASGSGWAESPIEALAIVPDGMIPPEIIESAIERTIETIQEFPVRRRPGRPRKIKP